MHCHKSEKISKIFSNGSKFYRTKLLMLFIFKNFDAVFFCMPRNEIGIKNLGQAVRVNLSKHLDENFSFFLYNVDISGQSPDISKSFPSHIFKIHHQCRNNVSWKLLDAII